MAASFFQNAANRANAQLSTGPRTLEGKERSRQNSYKHGFKALTIPSLENSEAVEASRDRWLACFPGDDEVVKTLADLSFRCKRRLETVADADDAAIASRVEAVAEAHYLALSAGLDAAWDAFCKDPSVGVDAMRGSETGLRRLFMAVDDLRIRAGTIFWNEEDGRRLLGFEGLGGVEDLDRMEVIVDMFKIAYGCEMLSAQSEEGDEEHVEIRTQAIADLDSVRERRRDAQAELTGRIAAVSLGVRRRMMVIEGSDERTLQLKLNEAKFDPSDEARLRRRYLAEAQREFLKALGDARKAAGVVPAKPAAKPVETPAPEAEAEESGESAGGGSGTPSEARSVYPGDADFAGASGSEGIRSESNREKKRSS